LHILRPERMKNQWFPVLVFGLSVKKYRIDQALSQEKLAELAQLDRSYISEIERGLKSASIVTLFRLSAALRISPSQLLKEAERRIDRED